MDDNTRDELLVDIHGATQVLTTDMVHVKADLKEHMRRTDASERRIEHVENHVIRVRSIFKTICYIAGAAATSVGLGIGIWKLF